MKMQYIPPLPNVDVTAPLIYMWEVHDEDNQVLGRYVGKANGGEKRPTVHYSRNVNRLLQGLPYRNGKNYRRIHIALADAVRAGHRISLSYLCNVPKNQNIFEVEKRYIMEYGCNEANGIGLNGPAKPAQAPGPMFSNTAKPAATLTITTQDSDVAETLDLEDFLEFVEEKYPGQFEVKPGVNRYSFRLGKHRIFRAVQSGPRGAVKIKLAQESLRAGRPSIFNWDGTDSQIKDAIETELAIYKKAQV